MKDRVRGRAYRRKANGEPAGLRQWQRYKPPTTDNVTRETRDTSGRPIEPPPRASSGSSRSSRSSKSSGRRRSVVPWIGGVAVAGVGAAGFLLLAEREAEPAPDPLPAEGSYRPIIDQATLDAVAAELERATGATEVLEVWIYGTDELRLVVPPETGDDLAAEYFWDGTILEKRSANQPRDAVAFTLDVIEPDVLVTVDEEARSRSEGSISDSRARIRKPVTEHDDWIYLTVDEVDHGGVTLWTDLEGRVESDLVNEDWRDD